MKYPVVLHKDNEASYCATVPDVEGCFAAGNSIEQALDMVKDAIFMHFQGMIAEEKTLPKAGLISTHKNNQDYTDGEWAIVEVDVDSLLGEDKKSTPNLWLNQPFKWSS